MLSNSFFGLKLKKLITQLAIFFIVIIVFFLLIQTKKNSKKHENFGNTEIIYEKNEFNNELIKKRVKQVAPSLKIKVKSNDTLEKILKKNGFQNQEIFEVIKETKKIFNPKNLIVGKEITIKYENKEKNNKSINSIFIPLEFNKNFYLEKIDENYIAEITSKKTQKSLINKKGFITDNLYLSGLREGINKKAINEMIGIFSFSVDFQRDIWRNDSFEILYEEEFIKYDKEKKNLGKILYANLTLQSVDSLKLYRFESDNRKIEYFDENGKSAKKLLMKTPIDGARLSSTFGIRKHPILGYNKMHRGVDFAALKGTPVFAGGNGTIEFAGKNGGYGNYIRIRHNNEYKTAYAHLLGFKKGISTGIRVNQGNVIGYVGSSGRSTGPHLHYEIIYQNECSQNYD